MLIVKDVIKDSIFGTIQNGKFVPIGKFDSIDTFEDDTKDQNDDYNTNSIFSDNNVYEIPCYISNRSRKRLEQLFVYGWNNKMPFRRRTLKKALRNKINSNLRWFA